MAEDRQKRNITAFNGEKYRVWKKRVRALLNELDLLKIIDDPLPSEKDENFKKTDRQAKGVIIEYLSDSFIHYAEKDFAAKEIFEDLDKMYERKSLAVQLSIRKQLLQLKLKSESSLVKHFLTFDDLIRSLITSGTTLKETDKVAHLLLTLPSTYDSVITAIETLGDENLTLAFVKKRLLDYEIKLDNESKDTSAKVLNMSTENSHPNKFKPQPLKKHKNFKSINKKKSFKSKKSSNSKCHFCGRIGHFKADCHYFKKHMKSIMPNNQESRNLQYINTDQEVQKLDNNHQGFAFMAGDFQLTTSANEIVFLVDSGATDHLINRDDIFESYIDLKPPIKIAVAKNGVFVTATKRGSINVTSSEGVQGTLDNVLYCPEVPHNLLSVKKMQQAGVTVTFKPNVVEISKNGTIITFAKPLNNLIAIILKIDKSKINSNLRAFNIINNNYKLWHQRLGHISKNKFLELKNKNMIDDANQIDQVLPIDSLCEACINGKQACLPFEKAKNKDYIKRPLFIIHSDVCGPITPSTINDKNYFVIFVDEFTHYCVTYLIKHKSDVFSVFQDFGAKSEARFNLKIVYLFIDNGLEYLSNEMKNYCVSKGITYHLTVPRTPQLNGVSERMIRTITEKARAMISGAKLDKVFWGEAVLTATFLINLTPTKALDFDKTPYELWHDKKPKLKYLRIFGSTVYVHNKVRKTKFDDKSWKSILVGYEPNGYKVWNVETGKFATVRDVLIDETNFLETRPQFKIENGEKASEKKLICMRQN